MQFLKHLILKPTDRWDITGEKKDEKEEVINTMLHICNACMLPAI